MNLKRAQSTLEYLIISIAVVGGVASTAFLSTVKNSFKTHFDKCKEKILEKGTSGGSGDSSSVGGK